jgi:hypothetical protein
MHVFQSMPHVYKFTSLNFGVSRVNTCSCSLLDGCHLPSYMYMYTNVTTLTRPRRRKSRMTCDSDTSRHTCKFIAP